MKLGPYELDQIYTGDARELAKAIPDESVDLIFTDPVYDRIDDYLWLAETAKRILKPDSAALVFYGIGYKDSALDALRLGLTYRWDLILYYSNRVRKLHCDAGYSNYTGMYWMEKGHMKARQGVDLLSVPVFDEIDNTDNGHINHDWGKPSRFYKFWLPRFVEHGAIVFDPFTGGGTVPAVCKMLGRHYLAFEIDPDTAERARQRVKMTQPPLFVPQPEQAALEGMA